MTTKPAQKRSRGNAFAVALKQAQRQLTEKLKQRMQAETTLSQLNYEIPALQKMITALEAQMGAKTFTRTPLLPSFEVSPEMGFMPGTVENAEPDIETVLPAVKGGDWK